MKQATHIISPDNLISAFQDSLKARDTTALQNMYHLDAELISSDNITFLRGQVAIAKYIQQLIDKPIHTITQLEKSARQWSDKMVSVSIRYQIQTNEGYMYHMVSSKILNRHGPSWQIIQQHVSYTR